MRLRTPEPHGNYEIDLCSEKTIVVLFKTLKPKVGTSYSATSLGCAELFVNCFSVTDIVKCNRFFFFVYCVDDSVVSASYAPFA